jgi:hypothetical protein
MSYAAPSVGPTGLTINSYQDILAYYLAGFQSIYGSTVYLGNDSADFQLLSLIALVAADANNALELAYNQQSPTTAIGAGLSSVVANNGLQRLAATFSTCQVVLTGTPGAVINNGVVGDINGNLWNLPPVVTIGGGGTVTAIATAQVTGAINITAPNQIVNIETPTAGWTAVNNNSNVAVAGQPVETDSQLRERQAESTELPSETLLAGTIAAVLAVPGVTRINNSPVLGTDGTPSINNPTGSTDDWGNPAHSITVVVDGGNTLAVATAIFNNRGIGALTNGNVSGSPVAGTQTINVTDPNSGIVTPISFIQPPVAVPIFVIVNGHPTAGGSLTTAQIAAIQNGVAAYLNSLQIGETVSFGELVQAAASAVNPDPSVPVVSIRSPLFFGISASPSTSTDVAIAFYKVATGSAGNITVNSV